MTLSTASRNLLGAFPEVAPGDVAIRVCDGDDEVLRVGGPSGNGSDDSDPDRTCISQELCADGLELQVTFDSAEEPALRPAIELLLWVVSEREQIEKDLESMYSSSLSLLEEASMVGDTMPLLSSGETEQEIAAMGLQALVVAASVERAFYVRYSPGAGQCEVVVQTVIDSSGRRAIILPYDGREVFDEDKGVVGQVLRERSPSLLKVPSGGALGEPGSPEHFAKRQVIAVPVSSGTGARTLQLGVLLVMDKRANSYSNQTQLGSQETKLTEAVASMLGSVLGARKGAELRKELALANEIHRQILPSAPAAVAGYDLAGDSRTSGDVGGDYFDYVPMADGRTMVVVADVSGHNLASGMVMVGARAMLRTLAASRRSIAGVFNALASGLYDDLNRTEQFITAVGAVLREDSTEVELANAGHHDTMWVHAETGEVEHLPSRDTIFGFLPGVRYRGRKIKLAPGDVLLLCTDGVIEATNPDDEMYGEERLRGVLREEAGGSAREILDAVLASVSDFINRDRREDDITAVVIKALADGGKP